MDRGSTANHKGERTVGDKIDPAILHSEMTSWRRHLHANPEFGFEEKNTAAFVVEKLREFGVEDIAAGIGGTGIVATIRRGTGNRAIGLRADMDALRIEEAGDVPHKSTNPGIMHACGHDGHTTMLLGAAKVLASEGGFDGSVQLIFQPAEEWGRGMQAMLDDGLLTRFPMDEAYGVHNMPGIPVGQFATRSGAFMAGEDNFEVTIKGLGGHAAWPHQGNDALVAACSVVTTLQTIVSRAVDPSKFSIVSVTELITDGTRNAIAGSARILGDARNFDPAVSERVEAAMRRIAEGTASAHGCTAEIEYTREFVPLINADDVTAAAGEAASAVAGDEALVTMDAAPIGGSEDFARLLIPVPGNFMMIGNGDSAPLHNPRYDFNDEILPQGVNFFTEITRLRLPAAAA